MADIGSNLIAGRQEKAWFAILKKMGIQANGTTQVGTGRVAADTDAGRPIAILVKAGAPATNTAADAPTGLGDLCWDSTNSDVYRVSAYTDGATFTWTKIVD